MDDLAHTFRRSIGPKGVVQLVAPPPATHVLAALDEHRNTIGACAFAIVEANAHVFVEVTALCVHDAAQGRGIASSLLNAMAASAGAAAVRAGHEHAYLVVKATLSSAWFYEKKKFYGMREVTKRASEHDSPELAHLKRSREVWSAALAEHRFEFNYPRCELFAIAHVVATPPRATTPPWGAVFTQAAQHCDAVALALFAVFLFFIYRLM